MTCNNKTLECRTTAVNEKELQEYWARTI